MTNPHLWLKLSNPDPGEGDDIPCHRPELSVWADEDDDVPNVTLRVGELWGQHCRYVEMTPSEARQLAAMLTKVAAEVAKLQTDLLVEGGQS